MNITGTTGPAFCGNVGQDGIPCLARPHGANTMHGNGDVRWWSDQPPEDQPEPPQWASSTLAHLLTLEQATVMVWTMHTSVYPVVGRLRAVLVTTGPDGGAVPEGLLLRRKSENGPVIEYDDLVPWAAVQRISVRASD